MFRTAMRRRQNRSHGTRVPGDDMAAPDGMGDGARLVLSVGPKVRTPRCLMHLRIAWDNLGASPEFSFARLNYSLLVL